MAITLEQSKVGMADKVAQTVVDEFRRGSLLLDVMIFDNAVSPGTGGSTLVYGYTKLKTPSTAKFRAINEEYTNNEAIREDVTVKLGIFGGKFELDRVIIRTAGAVDELDFQMKQKIMGAINLFHYTTVNGDSTKDPKQFNGLDVLLKGSSTEVKVDIDLTDAPAMEANKDVLLDAVNEWFAKMAGKPQLLLMNSKMLAKMKGVARRAGYYSRTEDAFGKAVDNYDNIPMVDLENYFDGAKTVPCVPIDETGKTSIYAVQIGLDAFHGVSPVGDKIIDTNLPDLDAPGVMKEGDVEMVAAVALKNSLKAGVLRGLKVGA